MSERQPTRCAHCKINLHGVPFLEQTRHVEQCRKEQARARAALGLVVPEPASTLEVWEDDTDDLPIVGAAPELENTTAVDHETTLRCDFCQRQHLGVRVVITKAGVGWVQVAAGAWISFGDCPISALRVRCAGCLLPEV